MCTTLIMAVLIVNPQVIADRWSWEWYARYLSYEDKWLLKGVNHCHWQFIHWQFADNSIWSITVNSFLRLVRRPQVLGCFSNDFFSLWQADSRLWFTIWLADVFGQDLAALCDMQRWKWHHWMPFGCFQSRWTCSNELDIQH